MTHPSPTPRRAIPGWLRGLVLLAVIGLLVYSARQRQQQAEKAPQEEPAPDAIEAPPPRPRKAERKTPPPAEATRPAAKPAAEHPAQGEATSDGPQTVVEGQTIRDEGGAIIHRGRVDVAETLARIATGEQLRFPNDGSTFQNRERRLPQQRAGYYREWVHPTPGLRGPGPQRIVTGQRGEIYYTPDHYRTFRRLDSN